LTNNFHSLAGANSGRLQHRPLGEELSVDVLHWLSGSQELFIGNIKEELLGDNWNLLSSGTLNQGDRATLENQMS
jgi:hypothetical protein